MKLLHSQTTSVCPVCLERIPAKRMIENEAVFLEKTCPLHGTFSIPVWSGQIPYDDWSRKPHKPSKVNAVLHAREGCPYDCGLCTEHKQKTCCVLMEVTQRCNLNCPTCFASAGAQRKDPPSAEIKERLRQLMDCGGPYNIQLSGGEPTMRDDLYDIITYGKSIGFTFFQLNTNGIRLAEDPTYAKSLKVAGLNCVFLQFDGLDDEVYLTLRGRNMLEIKLEAIRVCEETGLGVVLVPTLVKDVNTDQIGAILEFALRCMPVVRGVHFQPVSYFGRYKGLTPTQRFTLSDLLFEVERQTNGRMKMEDFTPGNAENPYCSMSGNFIKNEDGSLTAWQQESACCGAGDINGEETACCACSAETAKDTSDRAREFVARQWSGTKHEENCNTEKDLHHSLDAYLYKTQNQSLAVSAMVFMDAWNLDLDRLKECYIHVAVSEHTSAGNPLRLIPFCAYNVSSAEGETLYRGSTQYQ